MNSTLSTGQISQSGGQPRSRILLAILLCQIAFGVLVMSICLPSMPSWMDTFGETQARVQLTFVVYLIGYALMQLVYGPLSDNYGRRRVLVLGLIIGVIGSLLAAAATTLDELIMARALQGAGTCAGMVVGRAMIQDSFVGAERTRAMACIGIAMGICPPLGTIVGGQLHILYGWRASFVVVAALGLLFIIAAFAGLPAGGQKAQRRAVSSMMGSYVRLIREPRYLAFCLITAFTSAAFYVFLGAVPAVMDSYGVGPATIGWYILMVPASYIAGNALTVRIAGSVSGFWLITTGQLLTLTGSASVFLLAVFGVLHPLAVAIPLVLLGIGHGLMMPPALIGAVAAVPAIAGAAAAMAGMLQQSMGALASYVTGFLNHDTAASMAALMLFFALLALLAQLPLVRPQKV